MSENLLSAVTRARVIVDDVVHGELGNDALHEVYDTLKAVERAGSNQRNVEDVAISQGNYGQPDGSVVVGWRIPKEVADGMGMSAMVMPKGVARDLERLQDIATWWETGSEERKEALGAILRNTFPNNQHMRVKLWDLILPLISRLTTP